MKLWEKLSEFTKEKKQREEFEENVFNLIEDTLIKLVSSNLEG